MANILAVDDDRDLCTLLKTALERDGHTVETRCTGADVTSSLCRWADCILLDIMMPKLDGIDGATNYANCGGASWAVSSNCKNTELAFDFLKSTFGSSVELYDDLLPNAGAISSYLPAAESDVYNQPSEFYGGQTVYKDIVEFAGQVPAFDCGAYYSDVRSALTDAVTNVVQNNADIDSEMQNAQDTVEFNIAG